MTYLYELQSKEAEEQRRHITYRQRRGIDDLFAPMFESEARIVISRTTKDFKRNYRR